MNTALPISTISYNTPNYLIDVLERLKANRIVSFYAFIPHLNEDDEGGNKPHIHLYIEPSKRIQTDDLKDMFIELCDYSSKPLGCISFRVSKFDDWYLYALHDSAYLASKGQSRVFHYTAEEMVTSDSDDLVYRVKSINTLTLSPYQDMLNAQKMGVTWIEYFGRGCIPIQQITHYERAWTLLRHYATFRGNEMHELHSDEELKHLK